MQFKPDSDEAWGNYFTLPIPEGKSFTDLPEGPCECKCILKVAGIDNEDRTVRFEVLEVNTGKEVGFADEEDDGEADRMIESIEEIADGSRRQRMEDEDYS